MKRRLVGILLCMVLCLGMLTPVVHADESSGEEESEHTHVFDESHHWRPCECGCDIGLDDPRSEYSTHIYDTYPNRCSVCGYVSDHEHISSNDATCVFQAWCELCNNYYGELDPNNHNLELYPNRCTYCGGVVPHEHQSLPGSDATCGRAAWCHLCGDNYGERDFSKHEEQKYTCEGDSHRLVCATCRVPLSEWESHSYGDWVVKIEPTESSVGERYKYCICGMSIYEEMPWLNHTHEFGPWTGETKGYHVRRCRCSVNNAYEMEDCTDSNKDEICDVCQQDLHVHTYWPKTDEQYHWDECDCGAIRAKGEHRIGWSEMNGLHWQECKECYKRFSSPVSHEWEVVGMVQGHYFECTSCGLERDRGWHDNVSYSVDPEDPDRYHVQYCYTCGFSYSYQHWPDGQDYDDTHHWGDCKCGYDMQESTRYEHQLTYIAGDDGCLQSCTQCAWVSSTTIPHTESGRLDHVCDVCGGEIIHELSYTPVEDVDRWRHHIICKECDYTSSEGCYYARDTYKWDESSHWNSCPVCYKEMQNTTESHYDSDYSGYCDVCGYKMHEYYYVSNNDGTHTLKCDCGSSVVWNCQMDGGVCGNCGYTVQTSSQDKEESSVKQESSIKQESKQESSSDATESVKDSSVEESSVQESKREEDPVQNTQTTGAETSQPQEPAPAMPKKSAIGWIAGGAAALGAIGGAVGFGIKKFRRK